MTAEEAKRGAELVEVGERALREALPPYARETAAQWRPLLIAVAAMLLRAEGRRPVGFVMEGETWHVK